MPSQLDDERRLVRLDTEREGRTPRRRRPHAIASAGSRAPVTRAGPWLMDVRATSPVAPPARGWRRHGSHVLWGTHRCPLRRGTMPTRARHEAHPGKAAWPTRNVAKAALVGAGALALLVPLSGDRPRARLRRAGCHPASWPHRRRSCRTDRRHPARAGPSVPHGRLRGDDSAARPLPDSPGRPGTSRTGVRAIVRDAVQVRGGRLTGQRREPRSVPAARCTASVRTVNSQASPSALGVGSLRTAPGSRWSGIAPEAVCGAYRLVGRGVHAAQSAGPDVDVTCAPPARMRGGPTRSGAAGGQHRAAPGRHAPRAGPMTTGFSITFGERREHSGGRSYRRGPRRPTPNAGKPPDSGAAAATSVYPTS